MVKGSYRYNFFASIVDLKFEPLVAEAPGVSGAKEKVLACRRSEVRGAHILDALVEGVHATEAGVFAGSPNDGAYRGEEKTEEDVDHVPVAHGINQSLLLLVHNQTSD